MKNILSRYALVIALLCFCQTAVAQQIYSFTLMDAKEDAAIARLADGDSIHIPDLNTNELSIRANTGGSFGSILFRLDGAIVKADNSAPYTVYGTKGDNYTPWIPEAKTYTITATVHSLPQGQGQLLSTFSNKVTFTDVLEPAGPDTYALVLINADTDEDIAEITEGSVFNLEEIGTSNLNIRAECDSLTESVVFDYQGVENYHTENLIEYAIGANDDDDYRPWTPDLGANSLIVTAYTMDNGQGDAGNSLSVNFEIIEKLPEPAPVETPSFVLRINSGGEAVTVNDSIQFVADTLFTGNGKPFSNLKIEDILETTNDSIYKTERTANGRLQSFGYDIPLPDGDYEIKLHFAEIYWGATGGGPFEEGKRVFNASIEGEEVFSEFDMNAEFDPMTAIIRTFSVTVVDSVLNIELGATVDQPKISAIEIFGHSEEVIEPIVDCAWEELANSSLRQGETQGVNVNDKLYVLGGVLLDSTITSSTEIYDPESDTWSSTTPMPITVTNAAAVGVEEEIWVIAGVETDSLKTRSNNVQIYNTITNTWSIGPDLPIAQSSGAAVYNDGAIHFLGGQVVDSTTDIGEHYVLNINDSLPSWEPAAQLTDPRINIGAVAMNGKIYAIGGQQTQDSLIQDLTFLDEYDLLTDTWARKADLPAPRSNFGASVTTHNNKIIIVGGKIKDSLLGDIIEYDFESDSWTTLCQLPITPAAPIAEVFGDRIIVANGSDSETCCAISNTIALALETEIVIPEEPEETEISVLVYHETGGYRHGSIDAGIAMITESGGDLGWKVQASQTSDIFASDSLATYDVVIWMNTTGEDILTDTERSAFETYIQNGGGFVGVHSATDTYRNGSWPWYNELVGGIVQVNPYHTANNTTAIIDVVGEHVAVEHLGAEWAKSDEYYYWERNGGYLYDGNIDLLRVKATGANSYDAARPVTWYKEYDGGRSFYTALGHNAADYEGDENFKTMLQQAIVWAADKGELVEETPEEEPEVEETEESVIVLYPNPVIDQLFIAAELLEVAEIAEISIFGLDGLLMKQKQINFEDNQIDLSDLNSGYYIAYLTIDAVTERHLIYKE